MALKKHNPGCNCCPTDDPCVGFRECLGIQCVPPPCRMTRTIEIQFSGFSGENCPDCLVLNQTYLFPPSQFGAVNPCELPFFKDVLGICFSIYLIRVTFHLRRNATGGFELSIDYLNPLGAPFGAQYFHPDVFSSDTLCEGGTLSIPSITPPYTTPQGHLGCDYNGAPALLRVA